MPDNATPRVSIIIPAHDVEQWLPACLDSIAAQTLTDWEAIIVVDGMTDGTAAVAHARAREDGRFRVVEREHGGPGAARNTGLELARGDRIAFVDADDVLAPGGLEELDRALDEHDVEIAAGVAYDFGDGQERDIYWTERRAPFGGPPAVHAVDDEPGLLFDHVIWNKLYRRTLIERVASPFPERAFCEDIAFTLEHQLAARAIAVLPSLLYGHRRHAGAISADYLSPRKMRDWAEQSARTLERIGREPAHLVAAYAGQHTMRQWLSRARHAASLDPESLELLVAYSAKLAATLDAAGAAPLSPLADAAARWFAAGGPQRTPEIRALPLDRLGASDGEGSVRTGLAAVEALDPEHPESRVLAEELLAERVLPAIARGFADAIGDAPARAAAAVARLWPALSPAEGEDADRELERAVRELVRDRRPAAHTDQPAGDDGLVAAVAASLGAVGAPHAPILGDPGDPVPPNAVVWGAGFGEGDASPAHRELSYRAVRGPRSRARLLELGARVPERYGVPGMLAGRLPFVRAWAAAPVRDVAVVVDGSSPELDGLWRSMSSWLRIRHIAESRLVITDDPELLALTEGLGIPARAVASDARSRDALEDYALGTGRASLDIAESVEDALAAGPAAPFEPDAAALSAAFPLDLWQRPAVSVVVPTHNVETWVEETMRTLLAQTERNLEIIAVDDHSTDATFELLLDLAAEDPRLRPVRAPLRGGGSARNTGAAMARGEYLAFADGDDLVPAAAYQGLRSALDESGSDLAIGRFLKFSSGRTWDPTRNWPALREERRRTTLIEQPSIILGRACWNKLYRTDFFRREGIVFPDVPRSNDIVPVVTGYARASAIDVITDNVYLYRERPGGTSMTARAGQFAGLDSYLRQEAICTALVRELDSPALLEAYTRMVVISDGWVLAQRTLTADVDRDDPLVERIGSSLRELLPQLDAATIGRAPLANRAVFGLLALGELEAAQAIARERWIGPAIESIGGRAPLERALAAIAELLPADHPLVAAFVELVARAGVLEVGEDLELERARTVGAAIARAADRLEPSALPLLGRYAPLVQACRTEDWQQLLAAATLGGGHVEVARVTRTPRGLDLAGTLPLAGLELELELVAQLDGTERVVSLADVRVQRDGSRGQWHARVARVPAPGGLWHLRVVLPGAEADRDAFSAGIVWAPDVHIDPIPRTARMRPWGQPAPGQRLVVQSFAPLPRRVARAVVRRLDQRSQERIHDVLVRVRGRLPGRA